MTNSFKGPIRSRKRKVSVQRQGLVYLEQFDKHQRELKIQEFQIEERRKENFSRGKKNFSRGKEVGNGGTKTTKKLEILEQKLLNHILKK